MLYIIFKELAMSALICFNQTDHYLYNIIPKTIKTTMSLSKKKLTSFLTAAPLFGSATYFSSYLSSLRVNDGFLWSSSQSAIKTANRQTANLILQLRKCCGDPTKYDHKNAFRILQGFLSTREDESNLKYSFLKFYADMYNTHGVKFLKFDQGSYLYHASCIRPQRHFLQHQ